MSNLFFIIFLASILGLIIGIFSPLALSKILRKRLSRKQVAAIFGGLAVFSFIMIGVFAPPVAKEQNAQSIATTDTSNAPAPESLGDEAQITSTSTAINAASTSSDTNTAPDIQNQSFLVTHVVDGDTFDVEIDGKTERIRMIGIDTPETVDPRKSVQCFGKEASDKMKSLITNQRVVLEADPSQGERDKYDRLLRYAFLPDGRNVGLYLLQEGYAREYTYDSAYKYQQEFKAAEISAKAGKKGLWADNACATVEVSSNPQSEPLTPSESTDSPATITPSATTPTTSDGPAVKKSKSGICHQKGSEYYDQTKNFTAYETLQACLDSGGRMSK
jgi:micrococcal nuclease